MEIRPIRDRVFSSKELDQSSRLVLGREFNKRIKQPLSVEDLQYPINLDDIMYEVFRAMKFLEFEWKMLNAYHVVVRRRPKDENQEMVKRFSLSNNIHIKKDIAKDESSTLSSRSTQLLA